MNAATFNVERDEDARMLVATWDDASGGGITTQAETLAQLENAIAEAVRCHFGDGSSPREVRLHFEADPVLQLA
jgi:hypothetical protein